jgi:arylsulfatase A-like enzyme
MTKKLTIIIKIHSVLYILLFKLISTGLDGYAQNRPNIIFIMTDDQSPFPIESATTNQARPFGFCGDTHVYTPRIDSLAHNGMIFTNAYVSTSVCSASRYSILTGRYAGRCEASRFMDLHPYGTMSRVENNTELEEVSERNNLAYLLQSSGYRTGFVGKSHVVDHHLLDESYWETNGLKSYTQDADPKIVEVNDAMSFNHNHWVNRIKEFGFDYVNGVYAGNLKELYNDSLNVHNIEWKNKAVLEFIEQSGTEPFFIYYSENIPHGPTPWKKSDGKYIHGLDANEKYSAEGYADHDYSFMPNRQSIKNEVDNMEGKDLGHAWLTWFDYAVGSVVDKLKEVGKFDNTIIVITSDHGHYEHGKSTIYQGGVRVPLMLFWPEGIQAGSVYDELVQNIDYAPTFLELAGLSVDGQSDMDGTSLKGVLAGSIEPVHEHLFFEIGYARGVVTKNYKYITLRYDNATEEEICAGEKFNGYNGEILDAPYYVRNNHLGYYASINNLHYFERNQLYHLETDPWEKSNIYESNTDKAQEMADILRGYLDLFPNRPYGESGYNCNHTDIEQIELSDSHTITVFPTPANKQLFVVGASMECNYSIYNINGALITKNKLSNNCIDITGLKPGIYILIMNNVSVRFIKE